MQHTISLHTRHDANLTISSTDSIVEYVEFEKIIGQRYFKFFDDERFVPQFEKWILPYFKKYQSTLCKINLCWLTSLQEDLIKYRFPDIPIELKTHHMCHAWSLFAFTPMLENDLVVSFDGGGDLDDYFKIFTTAGTEITLIKEVKLNLGTPYRMVGLVSKEIDSEFSFEYETNLHLPGKIMALASYGEFNQDYYGPLRDFYSLFCRKQNSILNSLEQLLVKCNIPFDNQLKVNDECARNLLFTSQLLFEELFFESAPEIKHESFKRILIAGGCALNIKLNTTIHNVTRKEVFVSPVSGDCGISVGAAMSDCRTLEFIPLNSAYLGPEIHNGSFRGNVHVVSRNIDIIELAALIASGNVIATLCGKLEAGPRALGHRSLLMNPIIKGTKAKLNRIKCREEFRPVAPIVLESEQNKYFHECSTSRYMTFAPKIRQEFRELLQEIVHVDDSCRVQAVNENDTFIYSLLLEFKKLTGVGILANTSFNAKGRPITNSLEEALQLLNNSEIDYLYMDGQLIQMI